MNRLNQDNETEPTGSYSEQAADWWVALHDENATPDDRRAFAEWARQSPERISAWLNQTRLMGALKSDRVKWPDTDTAALIRESRSSARDVIQFARFPEQHNPNRDSELDLQLLRLLRSGRPKRIGVRSTKYAIAATVLIAVTASWIFFASPQHYQTALGEQRSVLLADGSLVTLNTASKIEVELHKDRRVIRLVSGEALFQVAHDTARPFDVVTDNATIRAVGTQFNVDRRATSTIVTVVEGKVAVLSPSIEGGKAESPQDKSESFHKEEGAPSSVPPSLREPSSIRERESPSLILSAAERVVITAAGASPLQHIKNIAATTAWTQRRLVFEHRPLGEVAEEFNRYNRDTIRIEDPQLAQQPVTGVFQANDPDSFMAFLTQIPGVDIQRDDNGTRVVTAQDRGPSP